MKNTLLILAIVLAAGAAHAQQTINQLLSLRSNGTNSTEILMYKQDNVSFYDIYSNTNGFGVSNSTTGKVPLFMNSSDNIGMGTTSPLAKLDVRGGSILVKNLTNTTNESLPMITQSLSFGQYTTYGTSINTFTESAGNNSYAMQFLTQNTFSTGLVEKMRINANGNVGIGTATPTEKLSVNGNIRAKEIKVEAAPWPDYVFEETYDLKPLSEVEQFIKIHKHLPDVPSAKQIEENGMAVGEMLKLQQKKIEELTLYLIEKDRENQLLKKEIKSIKEFLKLP